MTPAQPEAQVLYRTLAWCAGGYMVSYTVPPRYRYACNNACYNPAQLMPIGSLLGKHFALPRVEHLHGQVGEGGTSE